MAKEVINAKGWKCPKPTIEMTVMSHRLKKGDILEVVADCPSFKGDVKTWCEREKKVLIFMRDEGDGMNRCQIQL